MRRSLFPRFLRDISGQAVIVFTLASPVVIGGAGMAVDYSMWVRQQASLQSTADAASLAAAVELAQEGSSADLLAAADSTARNFIGVNAEGRTVNVDIDLTNLSAKVTVSEPAIINFAQLFGITDITLSADSEARLTHEHNHRSCILALDPKAKVGVKFSGSGSFTAEDCTVWSNSKSESSITVQGSTQVSVHRLCAAGNWVINGSAANLSGQLQAMCHTLKDPLAKMEVLEASLNAGPCKKVSPKNSKVKETIKPGRYCGGLSVSTTEDIELEAGHYIIDGGPLKLSAGKSVKGHGIGIYMTGKNATLEATGQSAVEFSAIADGGMPGIVLMSNRNDTGNMSSRIAGGASVDLAGTVYLPNQHFEWSGNSRSAAPTKITQLIAKTIEVTGTADIIYEVQSETMNFPPILTQPRTAYLAY